jgi:hypothetical protein
MRTCKQCGSEIVGRDKRAIFCGYTCKESWHGERLREARSIRLEGRVCEACGGPITSRSGKARCCSKVCSVRWQNAKRQAVRQADWEAKRQPCRQCGGSIPDTRRAGVVYCSERCKKAATDARWREKAPGYMRQYLYGITPEEYDALFASQGYRCAICGGDTPNAKGWHLDHDHSSKAIRGVLCGPCNNGLGNFRDDPAILRAAAEYVMR